MNEADTCRKFIVPLLQSAGWDNDPHSIAEQRFFTKGRIVVRGNHADCLNPTRCQREAHQHPRHHRRDEEFVDAKRALASG